MRQTAIRPRWNPGLRSWLAVAVLVSVALVVVGLRVVPARASGTISLRVNGNTLVDGSGAPVRLIGVNYSGTEYACVQGWGIFDGPNDLASVQAMAAWHVNVVRIPLNEDCWLGINGVAGAYSGANYQSAITKYVDLLNSQNIYAILELHWSAPGATKATGQVPMPDQDHTPAFWQSVANAFKGNPAAVFDLFNEPYPDNNSDTTAAWTCWKNGGSCSGVSYPVAGMQSLVNTVRATGATNVVMLGGVTYANSLSQWLAYAPTDPAGQVVAAAHVYGNNACGAQNGGACLANTVAPVAAKVPVVFGETGETYDDSECTSKNMQVILPWADANNVSYLAWTWDTWGTCSSLISRFDGTVNTSTPSGGAYAQYVHDHLATVAAAPAPSPSPSPTSSTPAPAPSPSSSPVTATAPAPMVVVSRGVRAYANDTCSGADPAKFANDASYDTLWQACGTPSKTRPVRLTYDLSSASAAHRGKVLVSWYNDPVTSEYDHLVDAGVGYNIPKSYKLMLNAAPGGSQPTSGWVQAVAVTGNTYHSRQHLIDMTGYNWIRLVVTASDGSAGNSGVALNMDVQDASAGVQDSWAFYGDSITQDGMAHDSRTDSGGGTVANFSALINATKPQFFPAYENGGIQGLLSSDGAQRIGTWLPMFHGQYVVLAYGTNDANNAAPGDPAIPPAFYSNVKAMVQAVLSAGKVPVLPTIPWGRTSSLQTNVPALNQQIANILSNFPRTVAGPDLYSFFLANQSLISGDNIHPSWNGGYAAYRQQWTSWALTHIYS